MTDGWPSASPSSLSLSLSVSLRLSSSYAALRRASQRDPVGVVSGAQPPDPVLSCQMHVVSASVGDLGAFGMIMTKPVHPPGRREARRAACMHARYQKSSSSSSSSLMMMAACSCVHFLPFHHLLRHLPTARSSCVKQRIDLLLLPSSPYSSSSSSSPPPSCHPRLDSCGHDATDGRELPWPPAVLAGGPHEPISCRHALACSLPCPLTP
ncbi:hypothetical protein IWZ03DRAFT_88951 [Phyllosticta citriasiana]|uniref:Uncharacterized protein n=1 Tax=Phyllosticta citriasiana TaxID=595635 RepID=A0ABR1KA96_9PEZI